MISRCSHIFFVFGRFHFWRVTGKVIKQSLDVDIATGTSYVARFLSMCDADHSFGVDKLPSLSKDKQMKDMVDGLKHLQIGQKQSADLDLSEQLEDLDQLSPDDRLNVAVGIIESWSVNSEAGRNMIA
jgi:hypothetical protein